MAAISRRIEYREGTGLGLPDMNSGLVVGQGRTQTERGLQGETQSPCTSDEQMDGTRIDYMQLKRKPN